MPERRGFERLLGVRLLPVLTGSAQTIPDGAPLPDGLSARDVELAQLISSKAQQLGLTADPSAVRIPARIGYVGDG